MSEPTLILASASPRRREILSQLGRPFEIVVSGMEERPWPREMPASYVLRNASGKARAVAAMHPAATILAADTIVVLEDEILEKPSDAADAAAMLRRLSGREHEVTTGVCARCPVDGGFREAADATRTRVRFRALSDHEIADYVATGEPMDKAGAYAIQGGASKFVVDVDGPFDNVVGLPLATVKRLLAFVAGA
ncbi:MAG: septum formation inhibitor Maf [Kiritimatiellae bacterium]|nr:septum formation inhibitor Maf [Kiritimatiellia bacterium]MCO5067864.1 Maf family protein [Kiritimatiellia bacterium]